jgi:alcohol dehydrogenase
LKAAIYHHFRELPVIQTVDDPAPNADGVVIEVKSTGLCLSDWHGWMGHDPDIMVPHVPGHELAGIVVETGSQITGWKVGDRVTLPFVCGCGNCIYCANGDPQICKHQFQPGFTHWGSFAQFVAIQYASQNLVRLPDSMAFETGSILGCRFATAFRAVVDQGQVQAGQWVAVHGCGGVGLSAVMIAKAYDARVIALDLEASKLAMAAELGADHTLIASQPHLVEAIKDLCVEGVHLGVDAVGHPEIVQHSIASLRRGGRHVQVGLIDPEKQQIPVSFNALTAFELQLMGSHGIQANRYQGMFELIEQGRLHPGKLITREVTLETAPVELVNLNKKTDPGITVINHFSE